MNPTVSIAKLRAIIIGAGIYNAGRFVGSTSIRPVAGGFVIQPASGLYNWSKELQPKIIRALKAKGIEGVEFDRHEKGAVFIAQR